MISKPMVRLAQTMHISCIDTNTVSKRKEVRLHMTHVTFGVPSGATKMIYEPMVCSMQLPCVKISMISKWGELSLEPRHLGVPSGASKAISKPMVRFGAKCAPILHRHLHCHQTERSEIPHDPCHQGVPSGASKMISEPVVRSDEDILHY